MKLRPLILPRIILVGGFALVAAAIIAANHGVDFSLGAWG